MRTQSLARAGEFFAASIFEERGIRTVYVDIDQYDLWCQTPDGRFFTVQVKSSASPQTAAPRQPRYYYTKRRSCDADLFAFVALDLHLLIVSDKMPTTKAIHHTKFTLDGMDKSIAKHFKIDV